MGEETNLIHEIIKDGGGGGGETQAQRKLPKKTVPW